MYTILHGYEIHYDDRGEGAPLLFMHAFPLNRTMFSPLPGVRLITFDAPGVGDSPVPAGAVSIDDLADLAAALMDHLGLERAVVGGVSIGGYAAFRFVARHAHRLRGLILSNTRPYADTEEVRQARYHLIEVAREKGSAEVARRTIPRLLGETTRRENPALVERVRGIIEAQDPEGLAKLLVALATRPDSSDVLSSIRAPTLVLAGEEDVITPASEVAQWAANIAGATVAVLPRCGHLPPLEQPEAFQTATGFTAWTGRSHP